MSTRADVEAIVPFTNALHELGIEYFIGGSVASSAHGTWRSTADIDIIADMRPEHVAQFVSLLEDKYYVDAGMIHNAIQQRGSFNVIHLETMYKLDVFALGNRRFDQTAWRRRVRARPFEDHDVQYPVASAEDTILSKLEWYRAGGEASQRQWDDVAGVLQVQFHQLDLDYLRRWAGELGVSDLLERAWRQTKLLLGENSNADDDRMHQ